jgi:activator of 2-hydroxyglutaryl-CoA dehydratase
LKAKKFTGNVSSTNSRIKKETSTTSRESITAQPEALADTKRQSTVSDIELKVAESFHAKSSLRFIKQKLTVKKSAAEKDEKILGIDVGDTQTNYSVNSDSDVYVESTPDNGGRNSEKIDEDDQVTTPQISTHKIVSSAKSKWRLQSEQFRSAIGRNKSS